MTDYFIQLRKRVSPPLSQRIWPRLGKFELTGFWNILIAFSFIELFVAHEHGYYISVNWTPLPQGLTRFSVHGHKMHQVLHLLWLDTTFVLASSAVMDITILYDTELVYPTACTNGHTRQSICLKFLPVGSITALEVMSVWYLKIFSMNIDLNILC